MSLSSSSDCGDGLTNEEMTVLLTRIEERTKHMQALLTAQVIENKEKHLDFEKRIRWNERFRNWLMGLLVAGSSGFGLMEWFK